MHFIIIFGPPAVGKMTVGYALSQLTGFKLFHNHMAIELILNFFPFGDPKFHLLVEEIRQRIFEEVATSDLSGLIYTCVWDLDQPTDKAKIDSYCALFRQHEANIYFVELEATQAERIRRNKTEFRLAQKASKRDILQSEKRLIEADQRYKLNSDNSFFYQENYIKLNNTELTAEQTASRIVRAFGFHAMPVRP